MPPTKQTFLSVNKQWRLTVVPRQETGLGYFSKRLEGKELKGIGPQGILERRVGKRWQRVWQTALVNEVAPPSALVSDDGLHVATTGNWFSSGPGPNVVVIYGQNGELIRSFALGDLLSEGYIAALPHSVSSIRWGTVSKFSSDGRDVIVTVNAPDAEFADDKPAFDLAINLASGTPRVVDPAGWCVAQAKVRPKLSAMASADEKRFRYLTEPLLGTGITDERGWQDYLWEAVSRLGPIEDGEPATAWRVVLPNPSAPDYAFSERWLRDNLTGKEPFDEMSFAGLDPAALVSIFTRELAKRPAGALAGKTVYVAIPQQYQSTVAAAFAGKGAKLRMIDPAVPILQRAERIEQIGRPMDVKQLSLRSPVSAECRSASWQIPTGPTSFTSRLRALVGAWWSNTLSLIRRGTVT